MKKKSTSTKSRTDFERLAKMRDEDIDLSDAPEITPEMFAKAIVRRGLKPRTKKQVTLRIDSDVLEWYRKQGRGYQTRINLLLRAYMDEHRRQGG
ncbi:MAG: BrnA antitoxin family protein [Anaerolineales bacterium]|nr:BrnA antitoxin family protein [Anaerolineales bacterium]